MLLKYSKAKDELTELDNIKNIGKDVGANAVRFVLDDYDEYKSKIGDTLNNKSHVWENGKHTDNILKGLCFILLEGLDHVYCYDKLFFVYTDDYMFGNDIDEIIIIKPTILHIIKGKLNNAT